MHEPRRTVAPASDCALEWCTSASEAVRTSDCAPALSCVREWLYFLRLSSCERSGLCDLYLFLRNAYGCFRHALSSCSKAARTSGAPYKQALWACKARAKDSCRNFIPKSIFEILLHKILKFSTRLNFKILTKPRFKTPTKPNYEILPRKILKFIGRL